MAAQTNTGRRAYVTLLTNARYLPGLLLLDHTMKQVNTRYPLVVLTTPSFPSEHLDLLETLGMETRRIELLEPQGGVTLIAERFKDTWSKLQAFALEDYDRVVLLDCDMTVFSNIDSLLEDPDVLPSPDWIAANHSCVCNPLNQDWYEPDCKPENCAYTYSQSHPHSPPPPLPLLPSKRTYTLLNSGLVVLSPSRSLYSRIVNYLHTSPTIASMALPDQDLLAEVFEGRWKPLSWRFNAIKTLRWVHPELWFSNDGEGRKVEGRERNEKCGGDGVAVLHYIVEKPWLDLLPSSSRDAETHRWWWSDWHSMLDSWRADPKLARYVERVEALVVQGKQE
ncbi:hypothetical protein NBRC10512_002293 [Rhodotorula toruloides]|uniref:RHTO0S08e06348g1_1 n=2 Tax=Rhodotorula toruloides TaxID=5286 RepID=A0A061B1W7_RHOTO|nr:glycosyltransferase family 8 protein [Rhodotorula toruloides NP11]EMS22225.1 glycosyltransferase family 8 protein [Rhodotorula toruloides NP11]KAJ8294722.1 Galactinol synthase 1 [Rhodotorula toruloides]CDR43821.1 RHTO0S08e06348g1_1 [Rhodotorula toruloides]